jgi:hypothetical protein
MPPCFVKTISFAETWRSIVEEVLVLISAVITVEHYFTFSFTAAKILLSFLAAA